MSDSTKRALGPGAKCCGKCETCAPAAQPVEEQDDFSWGDDVVLDPIKEDE